MKLGCMSLSYKDQFRDGKVDLLRFIDRAYEFGLDGVDIHTRAFVSKDPSYLRDIRMVPLLTREEEVTIAKRIAKSKWVTRQRARLEDLGKKRGKEAERSCQEIVIRLQKV